MQPEGNSTTRREFNDQRAPMGNPQLSSALNIQTDAPPKRRGGQTNAPPGTRGGMVRLMLPQRQDEGRSDRCSPRDRMRDGQTDAPPGTRGGSGRDFSSRLCWMF